MGHDWKASPELKALFEGAKKYDFDARREITYIPPEPQTVNHITNHNYYSGRTFWDWLAEKKAVDADILLTLFGLVGIVLAVIYLIKDFQ